MIDHCTCPQEDRLATGWGFRPAQDSPFEQPTLVRVHNGCDRPLLGHGEVVTLT